MFAIKRGGVKEYQGLFSRPSDAGQTETFVKFLSYPAQEHRRGILCLRLRSWIYLLLFLLQ